MDIGNIKRANEIANRLQSILAAIKELVSTVRVLIVARLEKERDDLLAEAEAL